MQKANERHYSIVFFLHENADYGVVVPLVFKSCNVWQIPMQPKQRSFFLHNDIDTAILAFLTSQT